MTDVVKEALNRKILEVEDEIEVNERYRREAKEQLVGTTKEIRQLRKYLWLLEEARKAWEKDKWGIADKDQVLEVLEIDL